MERVSFSVPGLSGAGEGIDLANVLNSLAGVADVDVDSSTGAVSIAFDAAYTDRPGLKDMIERSGYPVADDGAAG